MESESYLIGMMEGFGDGDCVSLAEEWVRRKRGPEWGHVVIQSLNRVPLFETPWTAARQASLSFTYLPGFAQTHVH